MSSETWIGGLWVPLSLGFCQFLSLSSLICLPLCLCVSVLLPPGLWVCPSGPLLGWNVSPCSGLWVWEWAAGFCLDPGASKAEEAWPLPPVGRSAGTENLPASAVEGSLAPSERLHPVIDRRPQEAVAELSRASTAVS